MADALQTAERIDSATKRAHVLKGIAIVQAEVGEVANALQTAKRIDDAAYRARALADIAAALAEAPSKR